MFMKVSHHGASVGIIEKIDHRAMAAGDENSVILIQARCDDIRDTSWIFEPSQASYELLFRGSSFALRYSSPSGPIAVTCVTYSPDFAQWKWGVLPGRMITAPGG
jgi:hypothetical protein